ncbi:hypothetical protein ACCI51_13130 [Microbulbifer echini]|uniref:Yip1 domain-containing protein n=1 Tax=Microbulbifer echini TaxID=1529067 RepID=A0ABV4NR79_9GAMM
MFTINNLVNFVYGVSISVGLAVGYSFNSLENLQAHKLLNLTGLLYDIISVSILSYAILAPREIQYHIAHKLSLFIIVFSGVFPAALTGGYIMAFMIVNIGAEDANSLFDSNSFNAIKYYLYVYVAVTIIPITWLFGSLVFEPVAGVSYTPEKRLKILGVVFLLIGFVLQIFGSFFDIYTDA